MYYLRIKKTWLLKGHGTISGHRFTLFHIEESLEGLNFTKITDISVGPKNDTAELKFNITVGYEKDNDLIESEEPTGLQFLDNARTFGSFCPFGLSAFAFQIHYSVEVMENHHLKVEIKGLTLFCGERQKTGPTRIYSEITGIYQKPQVRKVIF